ncbi:MAG TPA: DinB family protein [Dehalococcoidia bacterium]|nr:DinB family protein [Dehalococcoidia bacterium]
MESADEIRRRLQDGQSRLFALLSGVTEEQFKRRPPATADDPQPWCIAEVLAHLLSHERLWAERIRLALQSDGARIDPSPPEAHEENARAGRHAAVPQLIHGLLGVRREVQKLLDTSTGPRGRMLPNTLWHSRLQQRLDLAWMFDKVAGHHEEHIAQIAALREAVGARPLVEDPR